MRGSFSVQHDTTEQDFLIQRGKDKDGQQRQDHIGYGLIGKKFRHKFEGGGVIAWSQCESYRLTLDEEKAAKFPPTVRAAVLGLELDLLHYRHIDRRDPAIPVAHWQEDVIPPFAFESDAEAEDEPATPPAAPHDTPNNSLRLTDDEPTPAKPQPATRPDHLEL